MKSKLILFAAILSLVHSKLIYSQTTCDCLTFPIKQECKEYCAKKILREGSKSQLIQMFKIDDETAQKIIEVPNRKNKTKLEDFKASLPDKIYINLEQNYNNSINNTILEQNNINGDKNQNNINGDNFGGDQVNGPKTTVINNYYGDTTAKSSSREKPVVPETKNGDCQKNTGDYCFVNKTNKNLKVTFGMGNYNVFFTLQPGQTQCKYDIPAGPHHYGITDERYPTDVRLWYKAEGEVYVEKCKTGSLDVK